MIPADHAVSRPRPAHGDTRLEILDAAEAIFADKGYAAARLDEIAARVGIRRASLLYHFRDKRELYDAVLAGLFGDLLVRYQAVLASKHDLAKRVEMIVGAWTSYASERPAVARVLLREAAEPSPSRVAAKHIAPLVTAVSDAIREGQGLGVFAAVDPVHFIFTVVGATVFFVSATSPLVPDWPFDPLSDEHFAAHRDEVLGLARRLLGIERPSPPPMTDARKRRGHGAARAAGSARRRPSETSRPPG